MAVGPNQAVLLNVRLAFNDLFTPTAFKAGQPEMFRANVLVEPGSENDKKVQACIAHVGKEKFKDKWPKKKQLFEGDTKAFPYHDGNKKDYAGYEDMWALTAVKNSKAGKPLIVNRDKTPTADDGTIYSGCYVNIKVEFWAQDGENSGIRCSLLSVQYWLPGDRFGGGSKPTADDLPEDENLSEQGPDDEALA